MHHRKSPTQIRYAPLVVGIFCLSFFLIPAARAGAAGAPDCDFRPYLEKLSKIQSSALSENQKLTSELQLRKQALYAIIGCSVQEAQDAVEKLDKATPDGDDASQIEKNILRSFTNSLEYFAYQKSMVANLGLKGTKDMARELLSWRTSTHNLLREQAANFIIWNGNQSVLRAAKERLSSTQRGLRLVGQDKTEKTQSLFGEAERGLRLADASNTKAMLLLRGIGNPNDTLTEIRNSLEPLGAMYENFFELNKLLR